MKDQIRLAQIVLPCHETFADHQLQLPNQEMIAKEEIAGKIKL